MDPDYWLLTASERGNAETVLDARHEGEQAWSTGNLVRPLVHGATYFPALYDAIEAAQEGDLVFFTDWQGDADERLTGEPGSEVVEVLGRADERGVDVRGLVWRSHLDQTGFFATENRHLGEQLQKRGAEVLLDMRVRTGGSHHQKFVVVRYRDDPDPRRRLRGRHGPRAQPARRRRPRGGPAASAAHRRVRPEPALARRTGRDPGTGGPRRRDRLPRALGRPHPAVAGAVASARRQAPPPGHLARPAAGAVARAAAGGAARGPAPAHLSQPAPRPRLPVRAGRRAERRAGLLEGRRPGRADRLRRGPVLLGLRRRRRLRAERCAHTPSSGWSW